MKAVYLLGDWRRWGIGSALGYIPHFTVLRFGSLMDCNKEEALRAKEIAEKKIENRDFVGARKFALKAQSLYLVMRSIGMEFFIYNAQLVMQ